MSDQQAPAGTTQSAAYDEQLSALVSELVRIDLTGPSTPNSGDAVESDDVQRAEDLADQPAFLSRLQERVSAALAAGRTKPGASQLVDQAIDAWLESK